MICLNIKFIGNFYSPIYKHHYDGLRSLKDKKKSLMRTKEDIAILVK